MVLMVSEMIQMIYIGWWGSGNSCRVICPIVGRMMMMVRMVCMMLMIKQWIRMIEVMAR